MHGSHQITPLSLSYYIKRMFAGKDMIRMISACMHLAQAPLLAFICVSGRVCRSLSVFVLGLQRKYRRVESLDGSETVMDAYGGSLHIEGRSTTWQAQQQNNGCPG